MKIMIMDGQGGGVGRCLAEELKARLPKAQLLAVGTNAMATANMMKGGAESGATGENAVVFNSGRVDVIVGPVGIIIANAMMGEITPKMAEAVSSSDARLYLIPMNKCRAQIVGQGNRRMSGYIAEAGTMIINDTKE